jgi:hypothetical protein
MWALNIRFLNLFQDNKGQGKDALKFAKTFSISIQHNDQHKTGSEEDYYPMGTILWKFGKRLSDYKTTEEALAATRHLVKENQVYNADTSNKPEMIDEKFPEFSKFWYVFSKGLQKTHTQNTEKKLEGVGDLKTVAMLEQGKMFMEGLGFNEVPVDGDGAKIENAKAADLKKKLELLKLSYLAHCQEIIDSSSCCMLWICVYMCISYEHVHLCMYKGINEMHPIGLSSRSLWT